MSKLVVSERVTLNILSESDFNQAVSFNQRQDGVLPSSIVKKQRAAQLSRQADSTLAGIEKAKDRKSQSAVVKQSEFTKLQQRVSANEKFMMQFSKGQELIQGATQLTSPGGIASAALGSATRFIPGVGLAAGILQMVADRFIGQFGEGGTRDTRVKVLDNDVSNIGVENETDIASGRKLFLSDPMKNQGLPQGNSNTQSLRDGIRLYNLRREGSYS